MKSRKKHIWFFRQNGLNFRPLDLGVAVRIGLAIALRSFPLAGVAIGKSNRGDGPGGFLLLGFACFDLISLWDSRAAPCGGPGGGHENLPGTAQGARNWVEKDKKVPFFFTLEH
jgi:hypothetical protein